MDANDYYKGRDAIADLQLISFGWQNAVVLFMVLYACLSHLQNNFYNRSRNTSQTWSNAMDSR